MKIPLRRTRSLGSDPRSRTAGSTPEEKGTFYHYSTTKKVWVETKAGRERRMAPEEVVDKGLVPRSGGAYLAVNVSGTGNRGIIPVTEEYLNQVVAPQASLAPSSAAHSQLVAAHAENDALRAELAKARQENEGRSSRAEQKEIRTTDNQSATSGSKTGVRTVVFDNVLATDAIKVLDQVAGGSDANATPTTAVPKVSALRPIRQEAMDIASTAFNFLAAGPDKHELSDEALASAEYVINTAISEMNKRDEMFDDLTDELLSHLDADTGNEPLIKSLEDSREAFKRTLQKQQKRLKGYLEELNVDALKCMRPPSSAPPPKGRNKTGPAQLNFLREQRAEMGEERFRKILPLLIPDPHQREEARVTLGLAKDVLDVPRSEDDPGTRTPPVYARTGPQRSRPPQSSRPASESSSSSSSRLEVDLAGARAEAEVADELTRLEELELKKRHELEMLALEKKRVTKQGKVRVLESMVATERSLTGSAAGDGFALDDPPLRPRHQDVLERMATHGEANARVWVQVDGDLTDDQVDQIMREIEEDRKAADRRRPRAAPDRRDEWDASPSRSPRGSILGTAEGTRYGSRQERRVAQAEEGPWPGSGGRFVNPESQSTRTGAYADQTQGPRQKPDPYWLAHRDKLISPTGGGDIFTGDQSHFLYWWQSLQDEFNEIHPPLGYADKVRAIIARTGEKPQATAKLFAKVNPGKHKEAYEAIEKSLYTRFGTPTEVANSVRRKIEALKPARTPEEVRDLADEVVTFHHTMSYVPDLQDLNTGNGMSAIRKLLPSELQKRWATAGTQYKERNGGKHPPFDYFGQWLYKQSENLNDPDFKPHYPERGSNTKSQKDQKSNKVNKDSVPSSRTLLTGTNQPQAGKEAGKEHGKEHGKEASKKASTPQGGSAASKKEGGSPAEKKDPSSNAAPPQGAAEEAKKDCLFHGKGRHGTDECEMLNRFRQLAGDPENKKVLGLEK